MMAVFAGFQLLLLLPTAWVVGRAPTARTARLWASYAMGFSGLIAATQLVWHAFDLPHFDWSPPWLSEYRPHSWVPAFSLLDTRI